MFNNPSKAANPEAYIAELEQPRRAEVQELYDFICDAVPDIKPEMNGGMITWGKFPYKTKSGREGDWWVLLLASRKTGISFYVCSLRGDRYLPEIFKLKLGKAIIGKSCIRFKKLADINLDVLKKVIKEAIELYKAGKTMGSVE